jgi:hypothetical protein
MISGWSLVHERCNFPGPQNIFSGSQNKQLPFLAEFAALKRLTSLFVLNQLIISINHKIDALCHKSFPIYQNGKYSILRIHSNRDNRILRVGRTLGELEHWQSCLWGNHHCKLIRPPPLAVSPHAAGKLPGQGVMDARDEITQPVLPCARRPQKARGGTPEGVTSRPIFSKKWPLFSNQDHFFLTRTTFF